jgi:hypothetical protein
MEPVTAQALETGEPLQALHDCPSYRCGASGGNPILN